MMNKSCRQTACLLWLFLVLLLSGIEKVSAQEEQQDDEQPTCIWRDERCLSDPSNMVPMTVRLDDNDDEVFYAYVTPDVSTFYNETPGSRRGVEPSFTGIFTKFINLSNQKIRILWKSGGQTSYISDVNPFGAAGTASFPGHIFLVTEPTNESKKLHTFFVVPGRSLYVYDPFENNLETAKQELKETEFELYKLQYDNLRFSEQYRNVTGRDWLSLYGKQHPPRHFLWPADSFNQTHEFTTAETHFTEWPPEEITSKRVSRHGEEDRRYLLPYRSSNQELNLTMRVISCAPRAFEIRNFLSDIEVDHILNVAAGMRLSQSTTQAGSAGRARKDSGTRTSMNSWLPRETSPIIDALYRRSADLLRVDEALMRWRTSDEIAAHRQIHSAPKSIAERLQLVHYDVGQQYTPHHDFAVPSLIEYQPSRYATILFYLNDDDLFGGETSFPRWLNAETKQQLLVKPQKGKAILFYSVLPDGNYDERSQHAALPVRKGEKWLTNLWVWDPFM